MAEGLREKKDQYAYGRNAFQTTKVKTLEGVNTFQVSMDSKALTGVKTVWIYPIVGSTIYSVVGTADPLLDQDEFEALPLTELEEIVAETTTAVKAKVAVVDCYTWIGVIARGTGSDTAKIDVSGY